MQCMNFGGECMVNRIFEWSLWLPVIGVLFSFLVTPESRAETPVFMDRTCDMMALKCLSDSQLKEAQCGAGSMGCVDRNCSLNFNDSLCSKLDLKAGNYQTKNFMSSILIQVAERSVWSAFAYCELGHEVSHLLDCGTRISAPDSEVKAYHKSQNCEYAFHKMNCNGKQRKWTQADCDWLLKRANKVTIRIVVNECFALYGM